MKEPMHTMGYIPDHFLNDNEPADGYVDAPLPEGPGFVTRVTPDLNIGACSSYWPTMNVSVPRISMIDGPYVAANDNQMGAA